MEEEEKKLERSEKYVKGGHMSLKKSREVRENMLKRADKTSEVAHFHSFQTQKSPQAPR